MRVREKADENEIYKKRAAYERRKRLTVSKSDGADLVYVPLWLAKHVAVIILADKACVSCYIYIYLYMLYIRTQLDMCYIWLAHLCVGNIYLYRFGAPRMRRGTIERAYYLSGPTRRGAHDGVWSARVCFPLFCHISDVDSRAAHV